MSDGREEAPGKGPHRAPLTVGLVGAGPWASMVHAPMLASHPAIRLAGVWARRRDAAEALAERHDAHAVDTFDDLLGGCEAVAFAVPPDVQARLATVAAHAGRALLLEKPLALDVVDAERLVAAVDQAGVGTQMNLTWRYSDAARAFLAAVGSRHPIGARGHFLSGGYLDGPFATPWRQQGNLLLDLGPHVLDLLAAALGPVARIRGHGDPRRWVGLLVEHDAGVTSEVSLSAYTDVQPMRAGAEVYTPDGAIDFDAAGAVTGRTLSTVADEFVATASGHGHPLDVHHGLRLQRLLDLAGSAVRGGDGQRGRIPPASRT